MYYSDYDPVENKCPCCEENERLLESARMATSNIVKQLYIQEDLRLDDLECDIDDLCSALGVINTLFPLNIQRKESKIKKFVQMNSACDDWIEFNNNFLKAQGV